MLKWFLLLIAIPVTEIIIYVQLGKLIGVPLTLLLVFGTGIAGVILARRQGVNTLTRARSEVAQGRVPGNHLLDGLLIFFGALLLVTPGLLTDLLGLFLLIPYTRFIAREFLKVKIRKWINSGVITTHIRYR
ncbi:MAG: FxsA family protein [Thermincola sp.]|jgi:UPF0716 protein FxsA|nr:FxsA family protein [Thermincola sp.]MDT3701616.1 FxsA family protein [Thermincola sp.]